jgi:hypothetical protein
VRNQLISNGRNKASFWIRAKDIVFSEAAGARGKRGKAE